MKITAKRWTNTLLKRVTLGLLLCSLAGVAYADPDQSRAEGLAWLLQTQNGDGSWGTGGARVAATSEVLQALRHAGIGHGALYSRALSWLANARTDSIDSLARKIIALEAAGIDTQELGLLDQLIASRLSYQLNDSSGQPIDFQGWGAYDGYMAGLPDSALAMEAIRVSGMTYPSEAFTAFLLSVINAQQPGDHGWSYVAGFTVNSNTGQTVYMPDQIMPTAHTLMVLAEYKKLGLINDSNILRGVNWLINSKRQTGGSLVGSFLDDPTVSGGAVHKTALAVLAIDSARIAGTEPAGTAAVLAAAQTFLLAQQSSAPGNGSWHDDPYQTALVLRTLPTVNLADLDGDGLPDIAEPILGTNPAVADARSLLPGNGLASGPSGAPLLAEVLAGQPFSHTFTASGGTAPYTWSLASGALPLGMGPVSAGGDLGGTPNDPGTYVFTVTATDATGDAALAAAQIRVIDPLDTTTDTDGDGIPSAVELANGSNPLVDGMPPPVAGEDFDADGIPDNLDSDDDNDGVEDSLDAFPLDPTESADSDTDGIGDSSDNCPSNANPGQINTDGDAQGDVCDSDDDNDGLSDTAEVGQGSDPLNPDTDGDGQNDGSDAFPLDASESADSDGDGQGDNSDNCPGNANPDQGDIDEDGLGDACDSQDNRVFETVWLDDALPAGVDPVQGEDGWNWSDSAVVPHSGSRVHLAASLPGRHQHYFTGANFSIAEGDQLFGYIWVDPVNPPRQIMLQWRQGDGWNHRAYWGESLLPWGEENSVSRQRIGPLPASGQWIRLNVPIAAVGLDPNQPVQGMAFTLYDGQAAWDSAGVSSAPAESPDSDADGTPDNLDLDDDNDGVEDALDAFPLNAGEWLDTDNDGQGNNSDPDDDNDGIDDSLDAFPLDPSRWQAGTETLWVDDLLPTGARPIDGEDGWQWLSTDPAPYSGGLYHRASAHNGRHQHYFTEVDLSVASGDELFSYIYLDPVNPPRQVMLQWRQGDSWDHRAYWGESLLPWGEEGTASRRRIGDLPASGEWTRLNVPITAVGLDPNQPIQGMAYSLYDGIAAWDYSGTGAVVENTGPDNDNDGLPDALDPDDDNDGTDDINDAFPFDASEWLDTDNDGSGDNSDLDDDNDGVEDSLDAYPKDPTRWQPASETVWIDDALPAGVTVMTGEDGWNWRTTGPAPYSGSQAHYANTRLGKHQHYIMDANLPIGQSDELFSYIWLDPANPPRQVMLQWRQGDNWNHRVYWGESLLPWGEENTTSRQWMGPLPQTGQWLRLSVSITLIGIEQNVPVQGMAFTLYDGAAAWDYAGAAKAGN